MQALKLSNSYHKNGKFRGVARSFRDVAQISSCLQVSSHELWFFELFSKKTKAALMLKQLLSMGFSEASCSRVIGRGFEHILIRSADLDISQVLQT